MKRLARYLLTLTTALAGLAGLVLIIMWMSGMFSDRVEPAVLPAPERHAPAGATAEVHPVQEAVVEETVGTLRAERRTSVSSKVLATIDAIKVSAGDRVSAGDVLVVLDSRDLASRRAQAEQNVISAEANEKNSGAEHERYRQLYEHEGTSKSVVDQKRTTHEVAVAELERAREALREAKVASSDATIKAPVSGVVVDRLAEPGDMAAPGRPLLDIYDPSALRLEAPVREMLAMQLSIGQALTVHVDSLDLELTGQVDEIVPEAESGSRSFLVKVGLPKHERLYSGMFGRLLIPAGERQRVCMPRAAVDSVGQLDFVNVLRDGRIERRLVKLGAHSEGGNVEVLSGVSPGDVVVLVH